MFVHVHKNMPSQNYTVYISFKPRHKLQTISDVLYDYNERAEAQLSQFQLRLNKISIATFRNVL